MTEQEARSRARELVEELKRSNAQLQSRRDLNPPTQDQYAALERRLQREFTSLSRLARAQ